MLMIIRAGIKLGANEQMKSILQGPGFFQRSQTERRALPKKMWMIRAAKEKKTKQNKKMKSKRYHY